MSDLTINNLPVVEARLQVPRFGAWTGDIVVDAQTAAKVPTGAAVTISFAGQLSFKGTSYRADAYAQTVMLRVVGGTNGLATDCKPRFYNGPSIGLPVNDLVSDARETLSSTSDQNALSFNLPMWTMVQQNVALALSSLAAAGPAGTVWRVLPDGSIFFGVDGYPTSQLTDYDLIDFAPQEGMQVIAAELPNVFPGQTFANQHVSAVEHIIGSTSLRTKVWFSA